MGDVREITRAVDPQVEELLERTLANVRSGETSGVLILEQKAKHLSWACAGLDDRFQVIGFLAHAMHKMRSD